MDGFVDPSGKGEAVKSFDFDGVSGAMFLMPGQFGVVVNGTEGAVEEEKVNEREVEGKGDKTMGAPVPVGEVLYPWSITYGNTIFYQDRRQPLVYWDQHGRVGMRAVPHSREFFEFFFFF